MKTVLQSCGPKRRAILRSVTVVGPTRAKIVIVFFALAMVYGSICSASCASWNKLSRIATGARLSILANGENILITRKAKV